MAEHPQWSFISRSVRRHYFAWKTLFCFFFFFFFFYNVTILTVSSETVSYSIDEQQRFSRAWAFAQSRQNLRCSLMQSLFIRKSSTKEPDPWHLCGWACALKTSHYGVFEDSFSLDTAHQIQDAVDFFDAPLVLVKKWKLGLHYVDKSNVLCTPYFAIIYSENKSM